MFMAGSPITNLIIEHSESSVELSPSLARRLLTRHSISDGRWLLPAVCVVGFYPPSVRWAFTHRPCGGGVGGSLPFPLQCSAFGLMPLCFNIDNPFPLIYVLVFDSSTEQATRSPEPIFSPKRSIETLKTSFQGLFSFVVFNGISSRSPNNTAAIFCNKNGPFGV